MEDENWVTIGISLVGSLPILSVLTKHPIGYAVGIIWGVMGWLLMAEAFIDYKKMERRVKELEEQKNKK